MQIGQEDLHGADLVLCLKQSTNSSGQTVFVEHEAGHQSSKAFHVRLTCRRTCVTYPLASRCGARDRTEMTAEVGSLVPACLSIWWFESTGIASLFQSPLEAIDCPVSMFMCSGVMPSWLLVY